MGRSRARHAPGGARRRARRGKGWTFDFMGASRWFFSLSGTILLVGALAIGGKGLNFGIDFKSGTRIQTGVRASPSARARSPAMMPKPASGNAEVQKYQQQEHRRRRLPDLDQDAASPNEADQGGTRSEVRQRSASGTKNFSSTSIGPTFGKTVAKSAIIAIIASLLVISAYIALRFEWKYAVPVLIALMHDLLITAGVYSLTGQGSHDRDGRGAADDPRILAVRHDHRVRSCARERAAHAARGVLADRQPLDVRGADPVAGDELLHAAAGARAAALRRRNAEGLRLRADDRRSPPAPTRRSSSPRRC